MNQEITITQLKSLEKINLKAIEDLVIQLNPDFIPPLKTSNIIDAIKHPATCIFVAKTSDGKIIGMITLSSYPQIEERKMSWIEDFVVDKNYRKKGVGTKLITHAQDFAKSLGYRYANLTSRPSRVVANNYYKNLGYKMRKTNVYRLDL